MPILRKRGLFPQNCEGATLRSHFGLADVSEPAELAQSAEWRIGQPGATPARCRTSFVPKAPGLASGSREGVSGP